MLNVFYRAVVREVEDIQSGRWDDRIAAEEASKQAATDEKKKKPKAGGSTTNVRRSTRSGARISEPPTAPESPNSTSEADNVDAVCRIHPVRREFDLTCVRKGIYHFRRR